MRPNERKANDLQYARNCEMIRTLLETYNTALNDWEKEFLDSVEGRVKLTPKQQDKLNDIWDDCFFNRT